MILYLKELMKEKRIASVQLAESVGVSKTMVSYWLSGKNFPTPDNIESIAKALDVPVWRLFMSPESTAEIILDDMVAFFHYKGNSHLPTTVDQVMSILKDWKAEEFHKECHRRDFDHLRDKYADNQEILSLMEALCTLIGCTHESHFSKDKNSNTPNNQ